MVFRREIFRTDCQFYNYRRTRVYNQWYNNRQLYNNNNHVPTVSRTSQCRSLIAITVYLHAIKLNYDGLFIIVIHTCTMYCMRFNILMFYCVRTEFCAARPFFFFPLLLFINTIIRTCNIITYSYIYIYIYLLRQECGMRRTR